jgi:ABC-type molybdate transport system substrate-binding protein
MVLAYTTDSRNAATIAAQGTPFEPPDKVPGVADDWYLQLTQRGVAISGSHPFLDPGGYRADMIFQLAQAHSGVANLYSTLLTHFSIGKAGDTLGKNIDYQFSYEHGARAAAKADTTGKYRYARLPDEVNLGAPAQSSRYAKQDVTIPGLQIPGSATTVRIPASRVTWGLTVMKDAPNRDNAIAFLELLFSPEGAALQRATGPAPISPPLVSAEDLARLPASWRLAVNNVADERYWSTVAPSNITGTNKGNMVAHIGAPRTVAASVSIDF